MKRWMKIPGILLLVMTTSLACEDLYEEDLAETPIVLLGPADGASTELASPTFWWEELDVATEYQFQVVRPSFDSIVQLIADSTVNNNQTSISLLPGKYQWRVRGLNASSQTCWSYSNLSIDSTNVLTNQVVILQTPGNNVAINTDPPTFTWAQLLNADEYRLKVYQNTQSGTLLYDIPQISSNSYAFVDTLGEGVYEWGVSAVNASSVSQFTYFMVEIDVTDPTVSTPTTPANNGTASHGVQINFNWTRAIDNGSTISDSIFIATDSSFNNVVLRESTTATSISDTLGVGTHYWRLRTYDRAKNKSSYSAFRSLIVQ